jgi:hypothetical protein
MTASQLTLYWARTGVLIIESIRVTAMVAETIHHPMRFMVVLPLLRQARVVGGTAGRVANPSQCQPRVSRVAAFERAPEFSRRVKRHRAIGIPGIEGRGRILAINRVVKFSNMPPTGRAPGSTE